MGAIRGFLLIIVVFLLFFSLLIGNSLLTLTSSLQYDNAQPKFVSIAKNLTGDYSLLDIIEEKYPTMESHCQNNPKFVFNEARYIFEIPCEIINQDKGVVIEHGINSAFEYIYYKDYDCKFWDCFEKTGLPLFLISEKAKDYWKGKFYLSLIASIILIIPAFFLIEKKANLPILVGSLIIGSSLPLIILKNISFPSFEISILQLITIFFSQSHAVFIKVLIIGIAVLALGIALKLFGIGFKMFDIFSKIKERAAQKEKVPKNAKETKVKK